MFFFVRKNPSSFDDTENRTHVPTSEGFGYITNFVVVSHSLSVLSLQLKKLRQQKSRSWSQRGTKVNGSHRGDNPLLRPTGIQIATKRYATLQAMAPTNIKTVHQISLIHTCREQPRSTRVVVAYPRPAFSATNRTNYAPTSFDQT